MSRVDDLAVGDRVPPATMTPDRIRLFRYSAVTWNPHRTHYDAEYAREEGHPDVLVQGPLRGALVQRMVLDWVGPDGEITGLAWRNVGRSLPGETLEAEGEIASIDRETGAVELRVRVTAPDGTCVEGSASVAFSD